MCYVNHGLFLTWKCDLGCVSTVIEIEKIFYTMMSVWFGLKI